MELRTSRGVLILMDLDRFEELSRSRGYNEYKPNIVTGLLSELVERLVRKWQGVVVYGLDWERGTEEAVIEIPSVEASELEGDLISIAREIKGVGASITIVALTGPVIGHPARNRREAYSVSYRRYAKSIMEKLKRSGGGIVYVDGRVVWKRSEDNAG